MGSVWCCQQAVSPRRQHKRNWSCFKGGSGAWPAPLFYKLKSPHTAVRALPDKKLQCNVVHAARRKHDEGRGDEGHSVWQLPAAVYLPRVVRHTQAVGDRPSRMLAATWGVLTRCLPSQSAHCTGFPRAIASRGYKSHRVALRKRLGQHLLKNPDVVRKIVDAAAVTPDELVLEIGPGTGNMTVTLLQRSRGVFAVELDPAMHLAVTNRVKHL